MFHDIQEGQAIWVNRYFNNTEKEYIFFKSGIYMCKETFFHFKLLPRESMTEQ